MTTHEQNHGVTVMEPPTAVAAALDERATMFQVVAKAAADPTVDLDRMTRLLEMQHQVNARYAANAFTAAMAVFKQSVGPIMKTKAVGYTTRDGDFVGYKHATLGGVVAAIVSGLGNVGISHRWDIDQGESQISVTCILTHADGHSIRVKMSAAPDESGKKNSIQQVASTITYLQRYTLLSVTGLASDEATPDDDGRGGGDAPATITPDQVMDLGALISEVNADSARLLWMFGVESLENLPAVDYPKVCKMLEAKRKST